MNRPGAAWVADISTGSDSSFKVTWETLSPSTTPQPVYVFNDNFRTLVLDGILASTLRDTGSSLNPEKYLIAGGVNSANNPMPIRLTIDDGANGIGGRVWTVPTIPPTETGDHPSVEANVVSQVVSSGLTTLIAAPASGDRIRVLGLSIEMAAAGTSTVGPVVVSDYVYVANYDGGTVSVISTATNTVVATVTVGSSPLGAAASAVPSVSAIHSLLGAGSSQAPLPAQGVTLASATALTVDAGAQTAVTVVYTIEQV